MTDCKVKKKLEEKKDLSQKPIWAVNWGDRAVEVAS